MSGGESWEEYLNRKTWGDAENEETGMNDLTFEQKLRVEALRAASRIWRDSDRAAFERAHAAINAEEHGSPPPDYSREPAHILDLAEIFCRYLETGER